MRNSSTTKELYEKLIQMPNLHSKPELDGELLIWKLYENAYVRAYCNGYDACIDIVSNSAVSGSLAHWHPDEEDIFNELCTLGKKRQYSCFKKIYVRHTQ